MHSAGNVFAKDKSGKSWWNHVEMAAPDMIWGVYESFMKDSNPNKVNLGVGVYRDGDGQPYVLPSVTKAEKNIFSEEIYNHEYVPTIGDQEYCKKSINLVFGEDNEQLKSGVTCTAQAISGAGALKLGFTFLSSFHNNKNVYIPSPTWDCHSPMILKSGLVPKYYRYYNAKNCNLDFNGLLEDLNKIPPGSIIILQACAHNPTGVDPTLEQWKLISQVIKHRKVFPFFDLAYQGFASGDIDQDAQAVRLFLKDGHHIALAQSFAKIMGIYGQRAGTFTLVTGSPDEASRALSQLKLLIRAMYSNPPIHGARIVKEILGNAQLKKQWLGELKGMAEQLKSMRQELYNNLMLEGSKPDWTHIINQKGMFCYTGLNQEQCARLRNEFSVHTTSDGRICIGAINMKNVKYLAHAFHEVTKSQN